jgi:hypothetical protein
MREALVQTMHLSDDSDTDRRLHEERARGRGRGHEESGDP